MFFFSRFITQPVEREENSSSTWYIQAFWVGVAWMVLGFLPGWLVDRHISDTSGLWNDRFGIASMPGAALAIVALIYWLVRSEKARLIVISVLIGLAVGVQSRNLSDYRWSWINQSRFYSQLGWRVPQLEPDTLILSDNELFSKMGVYPTSFALNVLYPQSDQAKQSNQFDYWFLTLSKYFPNNMYDLANGVDVTQVRWQDSFQGVSNRSLVISYGEVPGACLWVLSPEDKLNPLIDEDTRTALDAADMSLIKDTPDPGYAQKIFFPVQDQNSWCYYYQKADLARQFGQWDTVNQLWSQAQKAQVSTNVSTELIPFIEADIHTQNWDQAYDLTDTVRKTVRGAEPYLCSIWKDSLDESSLDSAQADRYGWLKINLSCGN